MYDYNLFIYFGRKINDYAWVNFSPHELAQLPN